ncbi:putative 50 kDa protein in type I retrotransposable element R1DM [Temnothorax longispinosus]|uniref:Putative 50 kDa protein in type I retrotransposable element R1DM n=1 Tax=Temnothorax longispinosus TaxID=300112 RepID=A0A4S2KNJ0_9HYME|nr:putative 50 kDa protein in type I retrotransposable element R1DM [Temnothorax longispinosus]
MRVGGLDDSATSADVARALARAGGCGVNEIRVGTVRKSPRGLSSVWTQCSVEAANAAVRSGGVLVG